MPDTITLPNVDLQGNTPLTYKPLNQSDISAVTNPPPPVFKASNTDIQAVAGTQLTVIPSKPPVFGDTPKQAQQPVTAGDLNFDTSFKPQPGAYTKGRAGVKNIILHSSDGSEKGDLQTLSGNDPSHKVSANFYVNRAGKIYSIVPEEDTAWHAGAVNDSQFSNPNTIGIEQEHVDNRDDWPDVQVQATAKLTAYLNKKYGLGATNVHTHSDVAFPKERKQDPVGFPFDKFFSLVGNQAGQVGTGGSNSATAITPGQPSSAPTDTRKLPIGTSGPLPGPQNIPAVPGLTATDAAASTLPLQTIKQLQAGGLNATHYGYLDDPYLDPESAKRNGAYVKEGGLIPGYDVALNAKAAAMVGAKPGEEFQYAGRTWRYGDKVPEKYSDARFDIFDPDKIFGQGDVPGAAPQIKGDPILSKAPAAFGYKVASQQDADRFDQYVKAGGDVDQIPVYEQLAVAMFKNPNFLTDRNNAGIYHDLIYKPLHAQNWGEELGKAIDNIGPGLYQTAQNIGAATANAVAGTYDWFKNVYQGVVGENASFFGDTTPRVQTKADLAQRQATMSAGLGQGAADAYNLITNTYYGMLNMARPIIEPVLDANHLASHEQVDRFFSENLQDVVRSQQQVAGLGKGVQNLSAAAYGMVNAHSGELVKAAVPDESAVQGTAMLSNPLNVAPIAEGFASAGAMKPVLAFKPTFFSRTVNLGEEVAGAVGKKGALDAAMITPDNVMAHAAQPGFAEAQNVRAQFAPQQAAAAKAVEQTQQDLTTQLTRLGKTELDPSTATGFMSQVMQTGGKVVSATGNAIKDPIEKLSHMMSMGNPLAQRIIYSALDKTIFGALFEHLGPVGGAIEAAIEHGPEVGAKIGDLLSAMGKEGAYGETSLPYWTRVAQQTKAMPQWAAAMLDHPLVQVASSGVRGGVTGAATGAVLGAIGSPLNPMAGLVGGATQGGVLGMAGGGFGQWQKFKEPGQYLLAARGDWKRYRDSLPDSAKANFDQLSPANQLILGQAMQHAPDLEVRYENQQNGPAGNHFVDDRGRASITINLANPESAIRGLLAHELTHHFATHGLLPDVYDNLLGNPRTGKPGTYTLLDGQGKPVGIDPTTGRYITNQEFANLKNQYVTALGQSGIPTAHLTDLNIAREIHAEHGVDYLLSGGGLQDAASAFRGPLFSANAMKTAYAKLGFTFDDAGNIQGLPTNKMGQRLAGPPTNTATGTGLFADMQRNPTLGRLASRYFQTRFHEGIILASEEKPTRNISQADLKNPNVVETKLQSAAEIKRDSNGNVIWDPLTGKPAIRTPEELKDYNARFAADIQRGVDALSPEQRAEMGHQVTSSGNTFVRYLPNDIIDGLAKSNQYNPHQIASLRMLSAVLGDKGNPGMEVSAFYHKAVTSGKKYGQFAGSEKAFVPYGIEITKDGNVAVKAVDFNTLNNNYLKARSRAPYKDLWESPSDYMQDAHTYFTNHAQGKPGADSGIGEAKRDAINALGNFQTTTHADTNPLVEKLPKRTESIIKSYRIDRTNQMQATGAIRPFVSKEQYDLMNTNYLPKGKTPLVKAPAEMRTQTPERQAQIAETQGKAQEWLKDAGPAPLMSSETYLSGDRTLPKMETNQDLGEHINANHPKVDTADPVVREQMAHAFTHDVMSALSKDGNALGWYDDTVDRAMNEVSKVNPAITASPKNEMMFKLGLAVSSQGQKVHQNFETAYHVFNHFDEHGELPEDRANFGPSKGGKDAPAIEANFAKINRLHKELGTDGLRDLLTSNAKVSDLQRRYGVTIGGDAADEMVPGSKILGPKVGAFYANLNKNFDPVTMDLWLARGIHRMSGEMFRFSESAYREQISALRDQINNGEVPEGSMTAGQQSKILRQIDALEKLKPGQLTRERAQKSGKAINQWAQSVHDEYAKDIPGRGKYKDGTPSKRTAKNLDEGINKINDDPGTVTERTQIKDIYSRVQDNMKDAGIDISNADLQALTWYREQELFKKAGVLRKGSDNVDYLDGAYALGQKYGYGHKGSPPAGAGK